MSETDKSVRRRRRRSLSAHALMADFASYVVMTALMTLYLEEERQAELLARFPFVAEAYDLISRAMYELRVEEQRLLEARAILLEEDFERVEVEPPRRPVGVSTVIA